LKEHRTMDWAIAKNPSQAGSLKAKANIRKPSPSKTGKME
jgi:hypothetical protein